MSGKARDKVVTSGRLTGKVKRPQGPPDPGPPDSGPPHPGPPDPGPPDPGRPDPGRPDPGPPDSGPPHPGRPDPGPPDPGPPDSGPPHPGPPHPGPPHPGPPLWPQPHFSLYSTDSEDQVSGLHRGLDQCAALLAGILQADDAAAGLRKTPEKAATRPRCSTVPGRRKTAKKLPTKAASPGLSRLTKAKAAKSRGATSQGTASARKPARTGASDPQSSGRHRPAAAAAATVSPLAAHAEAKLHPPRKPTPPLRSPGRRPTSSLPASEAPRGAASDRNEDLVPVRDGGGQTRSETLRRLLEQLRALIAGEGSVAERLLSSLEQTVAGSTPCQPEEQLMLVCSGPSLQTQLLAAQSSLRELQDDFTELRQALRDTQSRLRDAEAEKALVKTELEAVRDRLLESEREKSALASAAEQRLKETENLRRLLQKHPCSADLDVQDPSSAGRIKQFLISLNRPENASEPKGSPRYSAGAEERDDPDETLIPSVLQWRQASRCDVESVWSRSESTFDSRDEAAFRDGLAALDASIASLQKTIRVDLNQCFK